MAPRAREDSVRPRRLAGVGARPLNSTVRQPMKRLWLVPLCFCLGTAFGLDAGEWIQVKGGSWEPDSVTLATAEPVLRRALEAHLGHKLDSTQWQKYSFQYQGWFEPSGRHTVKINAFCADLAALAAKEFHSPFDFTAHWYRSRGGGGSCFFSANYDVASRSVSNLKVNAPK